MQKTINPVFVYSKHVFLVRLKVSRFQSKAMEDGVLGKDPLLHSFPLPYLAKGGNLMSLFLREGIDLVHEIATQKRPHLFVHHTGHPVSVSEFRRTPLWRPSFPITDNIQILCKATIIQTLCFGVSTAMVHD